MSTDSLYPKVDGKSQEPERPHTCGECWMLTYHDKRLPTCSVTGVMKTRATYVCPLFKMSYPEYHKQDG